MAAGTIKSQRIDKWLWHARVVKTRTLAQKLVTGGKLRVDREKITNPSYKVSAGRTLTITLAKDIKILEVTGIAERRGPYTEACLIYNDLTPPRPDPEKIEAYDDKGTVVAGARPNQRDRKMAIDLKQKSH